MPDWEVALRRFLADWEKQTAVEGAVATGSYAVGNATPGSDIDVHIILSSSADWRERGNKLVSGFLIEYFANPIHRFQRYFEEDYQDNTRTNARMLTTGTVVFDKHGEAQKLIKRAATELSKAFAKPDNIWTEIAKYSLWDEIDGLKDLYTSQQPNFDHCYQLLLHSLLLKYSKFLGIEAPATSKLFRYLNDKDFRHRYQIPEYKDAVFANLLTKALQAESSSDKVELAQSLTLHVLDQMGGFKIDGWKIRTPATHFNQD